MLHKTASSLTLAVVILAWSAFPANGQIVADSVADFPAAGPAPGKQGVNGWTYGYHNLTLNGPYGPGDFIAFPDSGAGGGFGWTGTMWDWIPPGGNPPWTEIGASTGHPNTGAGVSHWAIRRWTSDVGGAANVTFHLRKTNVGGGDGTEHRVFLNGIEIGKPILVSGTDGVGKTFEVHVPNLKIGDTLDFALGFRTTDGSDGSAFTSSVNLVNITATTMIADSILDFPTGNDTLPKQGTNNWFYGRHNETANGTYQVGDFIPFQENSVVGLSPTDDWNGAWDVNNGVNPPWTFIDNDGGHPNGPNNAGAAGHGDSWAIRRYVVEASPLDGRLFVEAFLAKENTAGGDGTILHLFHNGVEFGTLSVGGTDGVGIMDVFTLTGVQIGDLIDLALDSGPSDGSDGSLFSARIFATTPEPGTLAAWAIGGGVLAVAAGLRRWRKRK